MSLRLKVITGFTVICLLWGSSWAAVKIGLETIPPLLALGFRFTIASIILGIIAAWNRFAIPRTKKFWVLVFLMVTTSFTIPFVLIYWAQLQVDSGLASVLFATYPFWVALVSHFLLPQERITPLRIIGIVIGFLGIVLIFHGDSRMPRSVHSAAWQQLSSVQSSRPSGWCFCAAWEKMRIP